MDKRFAFFALSFAFTLFLLQSITGTLIAAGIAAVVFAGLSVVLLILKKNAQVIFLICGAIFAFLLFLIFPRLDVLPDLPQGYTKFSANVIDFSYDNNMKTGIVCDVEVVALNDIELKNTFTSRMYIKATGVEFTPGDKLEGSARFEVPKNNIDFNAHSYYKTRGIDTISFCNDPITKHTDGDVPFRFFPKLIAHSINLKLDELLPSRLSGFISAVLIGDKTDFTSRDQNNFSAIGLAHVVAVSGMHLAFLAGFFFVLFGRKKGVVFTVIPILFMFTLIVGAPPSVVRALIMHTIMLLAPILMGEADSINSLSISLVLILLFNPYAVKDIGLQLSFLSTFGIIVFANRINRFIKRPFKFENKYARGITNFFSTTLSTSLSAIIFTTPVIAWNFGTVSLIAPISNMLLILVINIVFIISMFVVVLAFIYIPVAKILALPIAILAELILKAAVFIAEIPFAQINIDHSYQAVFLIYIYIALILFVLDKKRKNGVLLFSAAAVVISLITVSLIPENPTEYRGARFAVLDVGQGMAVLADYNGSSVLIDCGGSRGRNAADIVNDYLRKSNIDDIDAFVITHFDSDHMNGAKKLIEAGVVRELFVSGNAVNDDRAKVITEVADECGTKVNYINKETRLSDSGLNYTIYPTSWFSESNENGLVVVLNKDDCDVVVTGDLSAKSEKILCSTYDMPDSEVYIAGHHGSNTSSSIEFLNTILPEFAVISVGADNYYNHPSKETISLFEDMGIKTARTDHDGDIVFYSDELTKEAA